MVLQEKFVSAIVRRCLERRRGELKVLERDTAPLERCVPPFPRVTYDDAIALIAEKYAEVEGCTPLPWGEDLGAPHETLVASQYEKPVFVEKFPAAVKAFEGYGEIIGGSQRIHDVELLERRIKEHGLNVDDYQWYLDLRRYGTVPHSGFGMGIERLTAWIAGTHHIRETIPFPRMLYRIYP